MNNNPIKQSVYWDLIKSTLSSYEVKEISPDGKVKRILVEDDYFLVNNVWNLDEIGRMPTFEEKYKNYKDRTKKLKFHSKNDSIALELKFVFYQKLFKVDLNLSTVFKSYSTFLNYLVEFLNEKHPHLFSLLDLDIDKTEKEWHWWLNNRGLATVKKYNDLKYGEYERKTNRAYFLRNIFESLFNLTDSREEWEKDRWDVRVLHKQYGVSYNLSSSMYYLDFTSIENIALKKNLKNYIKTRLLSGKSFSWGTARVYISMGVPRFLNFITKLEPTWNDLNYLTREHILKYLEFLRHNSINSRRRKDANPKRFVSRTLSIVNTFLNDIQRLEYNIAPVKPTYKLIYPEDFPTQDKSSDDDINYISDYVLDQLFDNISSLHEDVQPVVWVAFKTGMRISDTLGLTQDCLIRLNGKYSVQTDIEKTYTKGHRIPIDDQLANLIAVLIHNSKERSNDDNNPNKYIFVCYQGSRKGKPFGQTWIQKQLNELAIKKNIIDETGNIFHFKTHQFRHTYAIKMLNGGADILTVQELLAHASPEMTMRYARLLDDTKRMAFENVIQQGVFTFDLNGEIHQVTENEEVPNDIMDMLWKDEKLNALDNPYGTCRARINGNCPLASEPPCLTANDGKPCFDLAVGMSSFDLRKYELLIETTVKWVEASKEYGREDMVKANEKNLERYQNIYETIKNGNVIFGRFDRVKKQLERKKRKGVNHV